MMNFNEIAIKAIQALIMKYNKNNKNFSSTNEELTPLFSPLQSDI